MKIGAMIKNLRRQRDLTQEQLAEYMNVSVSAVSQWESGKTLPDLATVLSLASFFEVSLDELFDRKHNAKESDIVACSVRSQHLLTQNALDENVSLWREVVAQYPGDYRCLCRLATALFLVAFSEAQDTAAAEECAGICERILRDCTDNDSRQGALQCLAFLHTNPAFTIASEETAVYYAKMGTDIHVSKQWLLANAYFKKESNEHKRAAEHELIVTCLEMLSDTLYQGVCDSTEEKIKACEAALKMWETVLYDGNYLYNHMRVGTLYEKLAYCHAERGDRDNTLLCLQRAIEHAKRCDALPEGQQHYTSPLVNAAFYDSLCVTSSSTRDNQTLLLASLKNDVFDFVREDVAFRNLQED